MKTQSNSAQNSEQQPTFKPDFNHRLGLDYDAACTNQLCENVDLMITRSKGVLSIISALHLEAHICQINPEEIQWALRSVMLELDDIYAFVAAHDDAVSHASERAKKHRA